MTKAGTDVDAALQDAIVPNYSTCTPIITSVCWWPLTKAGIDVDFAVQEKLERLEEGILGDLGRQVLDAIDDDDDDDDDDNDDDDDDDDEEEEEEDW